MECGYMISAISPRPLRESVRQLLTMKTRFRPSLRQLFLLTTFVAIFLCGYGLGVRHERARSPEFSFSRLSRLIDTTFKPDKWPADLPYPSTISIILPGTEDNSDTPSIQLSESASEATLDTKDPFGTTR